MNGAFRSLPQIAGRGVNPTRRLHTRGEMEELAAAFDGLAETLKEKSDAPCQNKKNPQPLSQPWLPVFSRFCRALRTRQDLPSIQDLLIATVEQVFPECVVSLCSAGNGRRVGAHRCRKFDQGLNRLVPAGEIKQDRMFGTSCATIPLIAGGEAWGTLSLFAKQRRRFNQLEFELLTLLADQAAAAMHRACLDQKLQETKHALGHAQASKSEFLSVISHEFRTPLNLIMGYTEIMQEELAEDITAEQSGYLKRVMKASEDILALVLSVLHVGSIESGCVELNKREVRLDMLLGEMRSDLPVPEKKDLELIWDIPADLPIIRTDAEKLKHILHKLIDNAVKFTDQGRVRVSCKSFLRLGQVEITVSDTGVGIPKEALPSVFEKYRQLDSSIARMYDGMGLGLFIADKLTKMLGGELKVASEPGKGSTFTVALPVGI